MRTTQKTLFVAISTALLTTASLYAQVKDPANAGPSGPSTSAPLGAGGLPGQLCSESPGATGFTCQPAIPDLGQTDSRFEVTGCDGTILDANIGLDAAHTWMGDLIFTVTSPNATAVTIVDRPGVPAGSLGCSFNNILAVLDDEGATPVENECVNATPSISGTFTPNNPLDAFDGETGNGIWLLTVSDAVSSDTGNLNDWSVDLTCEGDPAVSRATFEVNKIFSDGNPGEVDVTINCFTGLPITQTQTISEGQNVVFVVTDFDDGELDCEITETDVAGYSAEYNNGTTTSSESCEYADVAFGGANECTIINAPVPVELVVNKDWVIEGPSADEVDGGYQLRLFCNNEIVDGYELILGSWRKTLYNSDYNGTDDASYSAFVVPDWDGGTQCSVEEEVFDSGVEVDNGCTGLVLEIGSSESCTITNTVFYEGIPTLSNYGLALLTLMMLGVGFVGFRRFA